MRLRSLALLASIAPVGSLAAQAAPAVTEWQVPWGQTRPRDPAVASDGRIWFVGQVGNYVAVLDPKSGTFKRYDIDEGTHPHNVVMGPDGAAWYAGNQNGIIGRLDPATGDIKRFPMPESDLTDPHTLIFDKTGNLWFTLQGSNAVGHLDPKSGKIRIVRVPEKGSRPYGIVLDSKQRPWFVEFGINRIGTIDPVSFELKEYTIPDPGARPRRIALGNDDRIYAGDYSRGKLVVLDPKTGKFTEHQNPAGNRSAPYAMASDDQGRIWQVETGVQPNRLVSFDPKTESFGPPVPVMPSGGIVVRHMVFDPKTSSIWYGSDANTIGRVALAPAGAERPLTP